MAVSLSQIRQFMRTQGDIDRTNRSVQASGDTLEGALREAAIQLGIPVKKIIYEVIRQGGGGWGGKQSWEITTYAEVKPAVAVDRFEEEFSLDGRPDTAEELLKNRD